MSIPLYESDDCSVQFEALTSCADAYWLHIKDRKAGLELSLCLNGKRFCKLVEEFVWDAGLYKQLKEQA